MTVYNRLDTNGHHHYAQAFIISTEGDRRVIASTKEFEIHGKHKCGGDIVNVATPSVIPWRFCRKCGASA